MSSHHPPTPPRPCFSSSELFSFDDDASFFTLAVQHQALVGRVVKQMKSATKWALVLSCQSLAAMAESTSSHRGESSLSLRYTSSSGSFMTLVPALNSPLSFALVLSSIVWAR